MPNRYLPSALCDMVEEVHEDLIDRARREGDDDDDNYPAEYEAVVEMLKPEYQEEFRERRGEKHG